MLTPIRSFQGLTPAIDPAAWVADTAIVVGDVRLGAQASVWFGAVLRGDINRIEVGARTNIQDLCVLHVTRSHAVWLGEDVTLGHRVVVHGARVGAGSLIGIGALVLDEAEIGECCLVAAGSVVTPRTRVPDRSLVQGVPARVVRPLRGEELQALGGPARNYLEYAQQYRKEG